MIGALVAGITGSGGASLSSFESIASGNGTGSSGTITLSSIPSTFKHLHLRILVAATSGDCGIRVNSDSGNTTPSVAIIDILDYASTSKYKTFRIFSGQDYATSSGYLEIDSGLWMNTAAITSISVINVGTSWNTNTRVSLYGIKESA